METIKIKSGFEIKKTKYFVSLGLKIREALKLHKLFGLWGQGGTKDDWRNVSEHCIVVAARVNKFADIFKLSEELKNNLLLAAGIHDFYKKFEVEKTSKEGRTWNSYEAVSEDAIKKMQEGGIALEIINLTTASGHASSREVMRILKQEKFSEEDIAFLVMHYVDDYTIESNWSKKGQLDLRVNKNEANPQYAVLNEDGRGYYDGETVFETQRRVNKMVEERLAGLLRGFGEDVPNPADIPLLIDEKIKAEIEKL